MVSLAIAGGISAGYGLLTYNRKNFMFDGEQTLKREYVGQSMRIKRYTMYREDIRDLIELTVSKMDNYLIINTIQLTCSVILYTEGKPVRDVHTEKGVWPQRITWLYTLCNAGAFMYFTLSMWLAMHASIAAHSYGVRLLTQFVRLPVPNKQMLDSARAKALDFEARGAEDFFRVPVVKQQIERIGEQQDSRDRANGSSSIASDPANAAPPAQASVQTQRGGLADPDEDVNTPTEQLRHIMRYRETQVHWIGYDAYARVCMCMGQNQFVHALAYFCLGIGVIENRNVPVGFAGACVLCFSTWLVVKLDVTISSRSLVIAGILFLLAPAVATISIVMTLSDPSPDTGFAGHLLMIPVFFLHICWIGFMRWLARAEHVGVGQLSVALPKSFRSVTYLDVFGWLQTPCGENSVTGSEIRPQVVQTDRATSGQATATAEGWSPPSGPRPDPVTSSSFGPQSGPQPPSLRGTCQILCSDLLSDLVRWESPEVKSMLGEATCELVGKLRLRLQSAELDLQADCGEGARQDTPEVQGPSHNKVWLRLQWAGSVMEFYYCCETSETQWTQPREPCDRISDIVLLEHKVQEVEAAIQAFQASLPEPETPTRRRFSFSRRRRRVSSPPPSRSSSPPLSRQTTPPRPPQARSFASGAEVQLHDQRSRTHSSQHVRGMSDYTQMFDNQPPGQVAYRTFSYATSGLFGIWVLGAVWSITNMFGIDIPFIDDHHNPSDDVPGEPELIFTDWPHQFFRPAGLACHPRAGSVAFIASKYAVHKLDLSALPSATLRPALVECLAGAPDFHAAGIQDISIDCPPSESDSGTGCTALLLSTSGESMLRCSLTASAPQAGPLLLPTSGRRWRAVATGPGAGDFWALGAETVLELSSREGDGLLVPRSEMAAANATKLHVLDIAGRSAVVALQAEGALRIWPLHGGGPLVRELPRRDVGKWTGLCSAGGSLYLASEGQDLRHAGLWRVTNLEAFLNLEAKSEPELRPGRGSEF